jgi:hypothetical protein
MHFLEGAEAQRRFKTNERGAESSFAYSAARI